MKNNDDSCCEYMHVHRDVVDKVMERMPQEQLLGSLAELFRLFGDPTRLKILCVLFESEMCVCDLAQILQMNQSAISHHLKALKLSKLVNSRRDGKMIFYSLADEHVSTIIHQGLEHVSE